MDAAVRNDSPRLIGALLRHGVTASGTLPSGSTPLEAAALAGATKAVQVLLDNGADPNRGSPLEDAALKGYDSIVSQLLDHGALVNHSDGDSGATALYAACLIREDRRREGVAQPRSQSKFVRQESQNSVPGGSR